MRVRIELLKSVDIDDDPQLALRGISRMYTQLKLKYKAGSFESKTLHGYVNKNFQKIAKLIRDVLENGKSTSL